MQGCNSCPGGLLSKYGISHISKMWPKLVKTGENSQSVKPHKVVVEFGTSLLCLEVYTCISSDKREKKS